MMENNVAEKKSSGSIMVIGIVILLCCICLLVAGLAGSAYYAFYQALPIIDNPIIIPTQGGAPGSVPEITRPPFDSVSTETLEILKSTIIPPNDPKELACRMEGKCDIPDVMATSAAPRVIGDTDNFWVTDLGMNENIEVQAPCVTLQRMFIFGCRMAFHTMTLK